MREIVRFETNVPQVLALAFDTGKEVKGLYGDQVMYSLEGDNLMYVPPIVADRIQQHGIRKGEQFSICKAEVKHGRSGRSIEWQVLKLEGTGPAADPQAAKPEGPAPKPMTVQTIQSQPTTNGAKVNGDGPGHPRPVTRLEDALKTVITAVHEARVYAKEIGFEMPVFTAEDLRTMANTLMIEGRNGGRS